MEKGHQVSPGAGALRYLVTQSLVAFVDKRANPISPRTTISGLKFMNELYEEANILGFHILDVKTAFIHWPAYGVPSYLALPSGC
jgi:hypothetical protein